MRIVGEGRQNAFGVPPALAAYHPPRRLQTDIVDLGRQIQRRKHRLEGVVGRVVLVQHLAAAHVGIEGLIAIGVEFVRLGQEWRGFQVEFAGALRVILRLVHPSAGCQL